MSLVICYVTPDQIILLGESARPTENIDPKDFPNDAKKVLISPDQQIGIGLAGTLNFPWGRDWNQSWKWVEDFLRSASPDITKNPETFADALKRQIESLSNVPPNDRGIVMIAGFTNLQPEVYELEVKSNPKNPTTLIATKSSTKEFPRLWGVLPGWSDLLSLSGMSQAEIPSQPAQRQEFLRKMVESGVAELRAGGELRVASPVVPISIFKPKIAVLGWGSLVWNPKGDSSVGQKPLLIQGDFQKSDLELGLEYSRVSCDGRLTLVVDPTGKVLSKIHCAESKFAKLDEAIENLREREGMPSTKNVHFVKRGERHQDEVKKAITNWLDKTDFTGAIWTALPSNYESKRGEKFTPKGAFNYLLSLTGEIRDKAFGYIISAPDSVNTPLRRIARWPEAIAVHEAGHYVIALLLGRKVEEVWIQKTGADEINSGCRYEDGDSAKRTLLELILTDLAGPRAQVCYNEKSVQPWKLEKFKNAIVYPDADHHLYSWTGWHTTDLARACRCLKGELHQLGRNEELVSGQAEINRIDIRLRDFISRESVGRAIAMTAERLLKLKHISGNDLKALETDAKASLTEADYREVYP